MTLRTLAFGLLGALCAVGLSAAAGCGPDCPPGPELPAPAAGAWVLAEGQTTDLQNYRLQVPGERGVVVETFVRNGGSTRLEYEVVSRQRIHFR